MLASMAARAVTQFRSDEFLMNGATKVTNAKEDHWVRERVEGYGEAWIWLLNRTVEV